MERDVLRPPRFNGHHTALSTSCSELKNLKLNGAGRFTATTLVEIDHEIFSTATTRHLAPAAVN